MPIHTGGCLCGAVRYRMTRDEPLADITFCHCAECARWTGNFAAFTACRPDELAVTGPVVWYRSSDHVRRGGCGTCCSPLLWQEEPGNRIYVTTGTLDGAAGLRPAEHIHVAEKPGWSVIGDDAVQRDRE